MKLHLASSTGLLFTGYGTDYVEINQQRLQGSLIVTSEQTLAWQPKDFEQLTEADFTRLLDHAPELVLLGTGQTLRFPHPSLYRTLNERQIGVEVMDIGALCRTFNILASEGRRVVAAIVSSS